jgi:flagellar M-ring protein FliF
MQLLAALAEQLKALWGRWSIAQRVGLSLAAAACVAVVIGTMMWATRIEYVVLANQLTPQRAAEIVGALETNQIESQLSFSGSEVSVPRSDYSRARLALKDITEPEESSGESLVSPLLPGSPRQEEDRRRRSQEQRLARSIGQIRGVRSATVHISQPDPSPFAVEKTPVTASIIVDPAPNGQFSTMTAQSIVSLVARAVEGLTPENVSLMDTAGRQFSVQQGFASSMGSQFEYQQRIESHLSTKAESMLAQMLGPGRAVVRVTADIDFRETTRTNLTYDPELKVKRNETIETMSQTTPQKPFQGTGTDPNVRPNSQPEGPPAFGGTYKREVNSVDYENASTNEVVRDIPGRITRITVAAVVDVPAADPNAAAPGTAPLLNEQQVEQIIKQAVGFDLTRNDEVKVLMAPLERLPDPADEVVTPSFWQMHESLIQSVILGVAALIALVIGFMMIRRMKPVVVSGSLEEPISVADMKRVQSLADQAKAHPEVVASILAAWLSESENRTQDAGKSQTSTTPPQKQTRRAA